MRSFRAGGLLSILLLFGAAAAYAQPDPTADLAPRLVFCKPGCGCDFFFQIENNSTTHDYLVELEGNPRVASGGPGVCCAGASTPGNPCYDHWQSQAPDLCPLTALQCKGAPYTSLAAVEISAMRCSSSVTTLSGPETSPLPQCANATDDCDCDNNQNAPPNDGIGECNHPDAWCTTIDEPKAKVIAWRPTGQVCGTPPGPCWKPMDIVICDGLGPSPPIPGAGVRIPPYCPHISQCDSGPFNSSCTNPPMPPL